MLTKYYAEHEGQAAQKQATDQQPSKKWIDLSPICGKGSALRCIARGGSEWGRILSGLTVSASAAERQRLEKGPQIPNTFLNNYGLTGDIKFDPSQLFLTPTDWNNAIKALSSISNAGVSGNPADRRLMNEYGNCLDLRNVKLPPDQKQTGETPSRSWDDCVKEMAPIRHHSTAVLMAVVPTFEYKRVSQFDFLKNSGILITNPATPNVESGLNTVSFTWDLRRAISPPTARSDALAIMSKANAEKTTQGDKLCVVASDANRSFISVPPEFKIEGCQNTAKTLNGRYALACATSTTVQIGDVVDNSKAAVPPTQAPCGWK